MYSLHNYRYFNSFKSFCVVFKPKLYKLSCPEIFMGSQHMNFVDDTKYLGVTLSCNKLNHKCCL